MKKTAAAAKAPLTPTCQTGEYSQAELLAVLEGCWSAIRSRHAEIPPVILVVASGSPSGSKKSMKWGHFASLRWQHGDKVLAEVLVSGEGLKRPAEQVLTTLLHEAAHALADVRKIKDTSRQGRWHNEKFAKLARELGLSPVKDDKLGWSPCTLTEDTAKNYEASLGELRTALRVFRHAEPQGDPKDKSSNNGLSCVCECGRKIRVSKKVFETGPIDCGICGGEFMPDDTNGGAS